jgi:hypothetical protein
MQSHYLCFMAFEIALWLKIVINRWHIPLPIAPATYLSGISFQYTSVCRNEDSEHLSLGHLITPLCMGLNIGQNIVYVRLKIMNC